MCCTVMVWLPDTVRVPKTRAGESEELKRLIEQTERDIRYYQQGKQANASQFMPLLGIFMQIEFCQCSEGRRISTLKKV